MLQTIKNWVAAEFSPESAPDRKTIYRWIEDGEVPARKIGNHYYIDTILWRKQTGSPLLTKILDADE